jgi:hypothetical protein
MGRLIHSDGDVYKGNWFNGSTNGYGEYIHSDGTKYEGFWKDDQQDGEGKELWSDGSTYKNINRGLSGRLYILRQTSAFRVIFIILLKQSWIPAKLQN